MHGAGGAHTVHGRLHLRELAGLPRVETGIGTELQRHLAALRMQIEAIHRDRTLGARHLQRDEPAVPVR